jgi:serine protease AprX
MNKKATPLDRKQLEQLIFGEAQVRRFTQDSPILPDVWIEFGRRRGERVDLLLNPYRDVSPGELFKALKARLKSARKTKLWNKFHPEDSSSPEIAYNQSTVVAKLYFDELAQVVLPMTGWWRKYILKSQQVTPVKHSFTEFVSDKKGALKDLKILAEGSNNSSKLKYPPEWSWMVKVIGLLCYAQANELDSASLGTSDEICMDVFSSLMIGGETLESRSKPLVWTVALNREATIAIWRSALAVKADAARLLFNISCKSLCWGVIDSGIDATHPAFRMRDGSGKLRPLKRKSNNWTDKTRVKATYDFRKLRQILTTIDEGVDGDEISPEAAKTLMKLFPASSLNEMGFEQRVQTLRDALNYGYFINWDALERVLRMNHDEHYEPPRHEHGTHVAGILAGCWLKEENKIDEGRDLIGVCPDINLFDLRVLRDDGKGDEFSIMAALQFVRYLNSHMEYTSVHGVNMSLSIRHDVSNYACGCTPICEESNRLAHAGTVVVAAAGNQGYLQYLMADGQPTEGYRSISVTDPGNADGVITVGSTHAIRPHSYGVSFFSSRGPTGDGRTKPDLVAPGEKIKSAIPDGKAGTKDGTSMAAPHVSGAAALLMARHTELIGKPDRVKEILCKTASDLGRERYFQGWGMVDALRAIQSV